MNAEQEIVKPYLDKLKENISFLDTYDDIEVEDEFGNTNRTKYVDFYEVMETIDDLLSGEKTMTREEASKMAKAALECMGREVSGCDEMCNSHKCDECALNYEKGNMGEQKEWLRLVIKALEQDPILDKIRAEIMQLDYDTDYVDYDHNDMPQTETVHTICREEVLQIIDKYKAESEVRND